MLLTNNANKTNCLKRTDAAHARRGNSIVLVSAILVLLVIVATAFVSRTQAGRTTAIATRQTEQQEDVVGVVSKSIASEIALNLFARPINPDADNNGALDVDPRLIPNSNVARLDPGINPTSYRRYGVDRDVLDNAALLAGSIVVTPDANGDGFPDGDGIPDYSYNFAPYQTVAFTNPPDDATVDIDGYNPTAAALPRGTGNPTGSALPSNHPLAGEGNPIGNPGMGDSRYLRDTEPLRVDSDNDGFPDMFSHWRHLSNLSRASNGWRIVQDISDVVGGGIVENLTIPVEQWLAITPGALPIPGSGSAILPSSGDFFTQWGNWFGVNNGLDDYLSVYTDNAAGATGLPTNYYRLNDLDGNGVVHDFFLGGIPQDRPESEFIAGTARHTLSRVLTDTDGDGFTDALWHLAPTPIVDGVRHIVAVSVIDNSSMLNATVATRSFARNITPDGERTVGLTPSDLALASGLVGGATVAYNAGNVGFYDAPSHQFGFSYDPSAWRNRHEPLVGLPGNANLTIRERFNYWRRAGLNPLTSETTAGSLAGLGKIYRPFALSDEIELRMHYGNNHPWIYTSFEQSVQADGNGFLRAGIGLEESNELLDQLSNNPGINGMSPLLADHRHRLTLYSATRNELLPSWLWYRFNRGTMPVYPMPFVNDYNNAPSANARVAALDNFDLQSRQKVDLREQDPALLTRPIGTFYLRDRLPYALMTALTDGLAPDMGGGYYNSDPASSNDEEQKLAAGMTANILEARDTDIESLLIDAVPLPEYEQLGAPVSASETRYLGMEPQPFLVEAFIAHVYESELVSSLYPAPTSYSNETSNVVHDDDYLGTVIAIQLANPFDVPLQLNQYRLNVFGQPLRLDGVLQPEREVNPASAVIYAIDPALDVNDWLDFLDIEASDMPAADGFVRLDVTGFLNTNKRDEYDDWDAPDQEAIELLRIDNSLGATEFVVIDRFDTVNLPDGDRLFGNTVNQMGNTEFIDAPDVTDPPFGGGVGTYDRPGIVDLGDTYTGWVQWTRVTRAWGVDVDGLFDGTNFVYDRNERNPRYVFADRAVSTAAEAGTPGVSRLSNIDQFRSMIGDDLVHGAAYDPGIAPDNDATGEGEWFERAYFPVIDIDGTADGVANEVYRKPTFFTVSASDPDVAPIVNMPDKGWYGQLSGTDIGSVDDPARPSPAPKAFFRHDFAMQMLQKNGDFLQLGEIANMWLKGHEVELSLDVDNITPLAYSVLNGGGGTTKTFSEHLVESLNAIDDALPAITDDAVHARREARARVNRLQGGKVIGQTEFAGSINAAYNLSANHAMPDLPAGVRVMDMFVLDGPGFYGTPGVDDLKLANGFTGQPVYGMLNLNTAPPEVLRAAPHNYRLLLEFSAAPAGAPLNESPRVLLPEGIVQYREGFSGDNTLAYGFRNGPDYSTRDANRGGFFADWFDDVDSPDGSSSTLAALRNDRGLASIGEIMLVDKPANGLYQDRDNVLTSNIDVEQWQMSFAANDQSPDLISANTPFGPDYYGSMQLSTDVQAIDADNDGFRDDFDITGGDAEEANLLFSGMSNLVTTHSDSFTVYFRVRSFRQNPVTGIWDATDPEYIVDDARYVMLVDRSTVNSPDDEPKILYLEKLPN